MANFNDEPIHFIKCNKKLKAISLKDIAYITCNGYICNIHNEENKIISRQTKLLKNYEAELKQNGFVRINRQTILNKDFIKQIDLKTRELILTNDKKMTISRRELIILRKDFENEITV